MQRPRSIVSCGLQEQKPHVQSLLASCKNKKYMYNRFLRLAGTKCTRTIASCELQEQKEHVLRPAAIVQKEKEHHF